MPDEPSQWLVMTFLCGDGLLWAWHSGDAKGELEQVYIEARRRIWKRILLGGSRTYTPEVTGEEFSPDTEDEEEDGTYCPFLNFRNPLWKLQLCSRHMRHDPLTLLCDMLGMPP